MGRPGNARPTRVGEQVGRTDQNSGYARVDIPLLFYLYSDSVLREKQDMYSDAGTPRSVSIPVMRRTRRSTRVSLQMLQIRMRARPVLFAGEPFAKLRERGVKALLPRRVPHRQEPPL